MPQTLKQNMDLEQAGLQLPIQPDRPSTRY